MKKLVVALLCLLPCRPLLAQITLAASSYTSPVAGTIDTIQYLDLLRIPPQTTGTNQTWNLIPTPPFTSAYNTHAAVSAGSSFTTAQYQDNVVNPIGEYNIPQVNVYGVAANGLLQYGHHFDRQVIAMFSVTGGPNDTMIIAAQDVHFTRALRNVAFPAMYGNNWGDTATAVINATLTIPGMSFANTPTTIQMTYMQQDSIVGWGTLQVKNDAGLIADVNVLQVKNIVTRIDSTFINGVYITELQKDYLGLPRIATQTAFDYKYYAVNEVTPIADVTYDFNFHEPLGGQVLSKNYPAEGVSTIAALSAITISPNPMMDHNFVIGLPVGGNGWSYSVTNSLGQVVAAAAIAPGSLQGRVVLPSSLAAGSYYVGISNGGQHVATKKIVVE